MAFQNVDCVTKFVDFRIIGNAFKEFTRVMNKNHRVDNKNGKSFILHFFGSTLLISRSLTQIVLGEMHTKIEIITHKKVGNTHKKKNFK